MSWVSSRRPNGRPHLPHGGRPSDYFRRQGRVSSSTGRHGIAPDDHAAFFAGNMDFLLGGG